VITSIVNGVPGANIENLFLLKTFPKQGFAEERALCSKLSVSKAAKYVLQCVEKILSHLMIKKSAHLTIINLIKEKNQPDSNKRVE